MCAGGGAGFYVKGLGDGVIKSPRISNRMVSVPHMFNRTRCHGQDPDHHFHPSLYDRTQRRVVMEGRYVAPPPRDGQLAGAVRGPGR